MLTYTAIALTHGWCCTVTLMIISAITRWWCFRPACLCARVSVSVTVSVPTITKKDWCHTNNILHVHMWGGCVQHSRWCHLVKRYVKFRNRPNSLSFYWTAWKQITIVLICGSRDIFIHSSFFSKDRQTSKLETVFRNYKNQCYVHDSFNCISDMKNRWQIMLTEKNHDYVNSNITVRLWTLPFTFKFRRHWLWVQTLGHICWNKNEYRDHISMFYMTEEDLKNIPSMS